MNESDLTRNVVRKLNALPFCFAFRVHGGPHQRKGTLDVTGCFEGAFFSIEMKMPGKERNLTAIQAYTIKKVQAAGGLTGVATSWEEVCDIIGYEDGD